jgi:diphosphomevalonate decarboxylase
MAEKRSTALAHPNIAFIKYWGNRDHHLRLPSNGSISMNLASLQTKTEVRIDISLKQDIFTLNGIQQSGVPLERVQSFMGIIRKWSESSDYSLINSENNFPDSAGLASSASGFAALAAAASAAYGLGLSTKDLSRLARRGSGSAARSIHTQRQLRQLIIGIWQTALQLSKKNQRRPGPPPAIRLRQPVRFKKREFWTAPGALIFADRQ